MNYIIKKIYCQLSDGEAFGLSIIEAMGAGLPTIVNNILGIHTDNPGFKQGKNSSLQSIIDKNIYLRRYKLLSFCIDKIKSLIDKSSNSVLILIHLG